MANLAFFFQSPFDNGLRGDARVIGPRKPKDFATEKASTAGEDILDGVIENVAKGEDAGDVGRRNDDGIARFLGIGVSPVVVTFVPLVVKAIFHLGGFVGWGEFGHGDGRVPFLGRCEKLWAKRSGG